LSGHCSEVANRRAYASAQVSNRPPNRGNSNQKLNPSLTKTLADALRIDVDDITDWLEGRE
jgi:hypothetical protein